MTRIDRTAAYDQQNLTAAHIILADPERYAGLPVLWARAVIERLNHFELTRERAA